MKGTPAQVAAYIGKSERTIHRWLASGKLPYTRLPGGIIEVDDAVLQEQEHVQKSAMLELLRRIEEKLDKLTANASQESENVVKVSALTKREQEAVQDGLPADLTPVQDYCKAQGYSKTSVMRWIEKGLIPVHHGSWKRGGNYIKYALDSEGKAAVDRMYSKG
jgi:excisionase family DNA binding protein